MTDHNPAEPDLPDRLALMFDLYHNQRWSVSRIGRHVGARHQTVEAVLAGAKHADETAGLRARYPAFDADELAFTDDQLERMFDGYYNDGLSLSALGRELGTSYITVRRVLKGDHYGDRTAGLRARFPGYVWFPGITSFSDDELEDVFVGYFDRDESLKTLSEMYGVSRHTIRDLIAGRKGAAQTEHLRAKYGSNIYPQGPSGHRARQPGVRSAATG